MLRTLTICLFSFLFLNIGWSQKDNIRSTDRSHLQFNGSSTNSELEFRLDSTIIDPPSYDEECSSAVTEFVFNAEDAWGFANGTNGFFDVAKAQRFDFDQTSNYSVIGAIVFFGTISVVNDGAVTAGVWNANEDGSPNELVGISDSIKVSDLISNTSGEVLPSIFVFSEPAEVNTSQHFIDVEFFNLYFSEDTLGILSTDIGCGTGADTWELLITDTLGTTEWFSYDGSGPSGELDIDLLISSIVEFDLSTSVEDAYVQKNGLTLYPVTPNPASEQVTFNFELDQTEEVILEVYQADGRIVQKKNLGQRSIGKHTAPLEINNLSSGSYFYGIVTDQSRLMSRFIVQR